MAAPDPSPPPPRSGFVAGVLVGLLASLLVAVVTVGAIVVLRDEDEGTVGASPDALPGSESPAEVVRTFEEQESVEGARFHLLVGELIREYDCRVHSFGVDSREPLRAYLTECAILEEQDVHVSLFSVLLRNGTEAPLTYDLRNFVLTARDGSTFGAVNIATSARVSTANYIPETGLLPPGALVDGWLTFDVRTGRAPPIPARISYIDGGQTLTIEFEGTHTVT